ncbi:hypothetical protein AAVH_41093 [Aphelenchoides avenae]|nr:hypothetical protein AAVH_41093 [Aphelenchus avenae]
MYWDMYDSPPEPGGSYATHPAHAVFHAIMLAVSIVDLLLQAYTVHLMCRVATKQLREYRYFMMLCTVGGPLRVQWIQTS